MKLDDMKTIGADELAKLLGRSPETVKSDVRRRPHTLPTRLKIPGSKQLLWLESDVVTFLQKARVTTHRVR